MKRKKRQREKFRFKRMQKVIVVFLALVAVLCVVQRNVTYTHQERILTPLAKEAFSPQGEAQEPECLLIYEDSARGNQGYTLMSEVLDQMKVPWESCLAGEAASRNLDRYTKIVLSVDYLRNLGDGLLELQDWIRAGGHLLVLYPPEIDSGFQSLQDLMGIVGISPDLAVVEELRFVKNFMIGTEGLDLRITDAYESSLSVSLDSDCEVYMESGGENPVPLLWRKETGEGSVVVDNLSFLEKAYRGFHCAAYTLLGDAEAYPVINGSTFYIDDFPSPVPGGDSRKIREDYGMDIADFYTQVWWNDVYNLGKEYGIRYTGLVIEQYSDQVEGPFERNSDTQRYEYFGNMLLDAGGEIGFHGYNHMPLCLENFSYQGMYDSYKQWASYEDMRAALQELHDFCAQIFPQEEFQVYVPPSNILSEEGRGMLAEDFPQIQAVASVYLPGDLAFEQEFEVAEDGIIDTPRVISGYVLDDYMRLAAMAELNFHFVNSHFQHPDDVLDVDRGADLGWEELFRRISEYTEWLYTSAPAIRNLTGTELAAAVQQYDYLTVDRTLTEHSLELTLGGFGTQAWLMVRINEGEPGTVTGGELTKMAEGLYLLQADEEQVTIELVK
ncbi:MAG TPA: DUF2194 domain-containing protein [Candidatus Merdisoma merdipullorum]|nr:DUF2194 domain-containing protein [Candidatus Merdisoma merdipullorum]